MSGLFFLLFAVVGLVGAVMMVVQRNPVVSALHLVLAMMSISALYVLLHAPFLALVQVIVYAGAIMVLFVFVIMLLNLRHDIDDGLHHSARRVLGWGFGLVLAAILVVVLRRPWALGPAGVDSPAAVARIGNTEAVGLRLYGEYLFPFEVTSLILLVGILGAVALAKRREGPPRAAPHVPAVPREAIAPTAGAPPAPTEPAAIREPIAEAGPPPTVPAAPPAQPAEGAS